MQEMVCCTIPYHPMQDVPHCIGTLSRTVPILSVLSRIVSMTL